MHTLFHCCNCNYPLLLSVDDGRKKNGLQYSLGGYIRGYSIHVVKTVFRALFINEYGTGIQYSLVNNVRGYTKLGILDSLRHRTNYALNTPDRP